MEYFLVRYNSRVKIYERKMFIRLDTVQTQIGYLVLVQEDPKQQQMFWAERGVKEGVISPL